MSRLPEGWEDANIGDLAEYVSRGKSPKYVEKSGLPVINQRCVRWQGVDEAFVKFVDPATWHQWNDERYVRHNDILWNSTGTGTIGRAALFTGLPTYDNVVVDSHVTIVRAGPAIIPAYLFRFIQSPAVQDNIESMQSGSTNQVELNRSEIVSTVVPVAPLAEQQRLVSKLNTLTAATARARKELDRIPDLIARYKQRLLAAVFSRDGVANWSHETVGSISSLVTSGSRGWAQFYSSQGDLFVRVGNVRRTDINLDLEQVQHVNPPSGVEGRRTQLQSGDVLVTITADLGRVGVFETTKNAYVNQHVALVRLEDPQQARFVAWYLSSEVGQAQLLKNTRGATKAGLGLDDIRGVLIPMPGAEEQAEIVRRIESAFAWLNRVIADHAAAFRLLPKLDAATLAKAFRGGLVPQDPSDEPASTLLSRVKAQQAQQPRKETMKRPRPIASEEHAMTIAKTMEQVLTEAGDWLPAQTAFERCGVGDHAPTEEIEQLYEELRDLDATGRLEAQAVTNERGQKRFDRLRLKAA